MVRVTIEEIQRDPLEYLRRVEGGETLVIVRSHEAIAEIRPITPSQQLRPYGLCTGEFVVPDDFDAPLPNEATDKQKLFELLDLELHPTPYKPDPEIQPENFENEGQWLIAVFERLFSQIEPSEIPIQPRESIRVDETLEDMESAISQGIQGQWQDCSGNVIGGGGKKPGF